MDLANSLRKALANQFEKRRRRQRHRFAGRVLRCEPLEDRRLLARTAAVLEGSDSQTATLVGHNPETAIDNNDVQARFIVSGNLPVAGPQIGFRSNTLDQRGVLPESTNVPGHTPKRQPEVSNSLNGTENTESTSIFEWYQVSTSVPAGDAGEGESSASSNPEGGSYCTPPSVTISLSPTPIDEGESTTLTINPSGECLGSLYVDWGDGQTLTMSISDDTQQMLYHFYQDDNPSGTPSDVYTVTVTVSGMAGSATDTAQLTVNNLAPSVSLGAPASVTEGSSFDLSIDIGDYEPNGSFDVVIDWGDNTSETFSTTSRNLIRSHSYEDDNPTGTPSDIYTISVTVTDDDTGSTTVSRGITINNAKPTLSVSSGSVDENATYILSGSIGDVGIHDTHDLTIDWGDGASETHSGVGRGPFSFTHVYEDDGSSPGNGTAFDNYTITVTVVDDDTGSLTQEATVTVNNVAPVIGSVSSPSAVRIGNAVTLSGSFHDQGVKDEHTVVVSWGADSDADGALDQTTLKLAAGITSFSTSYTYTSIDGYTVHYEEVGVSVLDDDQGQDSASVLIGLYDEIDLDTDSNNDGTIDYDNQGTDDPIEHQSGAYRAVILRNTDDDNVDGTPDHEQNPVAGENDLRLLTLNPHPGYLPSSSGTWTVRLVGGSSQLIRFWDSSSKQNLLPLTLEWTLGTDVIPSGIHVEGLVAGETTAMLSLLHDGSPKYRDQVTLSVVERVDLDIDSDNDNRLGAPARTDSEDQVEEDWPGKYVPVNVNDKDGDTVPDYADGYDLDGVINNQDDSNASEDFADLVLEIPPWVDFSTATVTFTYSASSPDAVLDEASDFARPPGLLRVWTTEGPRDKRPVDAGHFVDTGTAYALAKLGIAGGGPKTLYVEGVSAGVGSIHVTLDPGSDMARHFVTVDEVKANVVEVDLDIDSDNTLNAKDPDEDALEDRIEDKPGTAGKYVAANSGDADGDGIPDLADGFNRDGTIGNADDVTTGDAFVPLVLKLPEPVEPSKAMLTISYSASDPSYTGNMPAPGHLRIWTKDGGQSRNKQKVTLGGDYVAPGTYAPSDLAIDATTRRVTLYVEGIAASQLGERIVVEVDPDGAAGSASYEISDAVRVTVVDADVDVDTDNNNGLQQPDRSALEESIEDVAFDSTKPGKWLVANRRDVDRDGIIDFADFNNNSVLAGFTPLVLEVPKPIDPNERVIRLNYSASDPAALIATGSGYDPAPGHLRIWTRDGHQLRNPSELSAGGHFVSSSSYYSLVDLGGDPTGANRTVTLYAEGIAIAPATAPSAGNRGNLLGQTRIQAQIDFGTLQQSLHSLEDALLVTVVDQVAINATNAYAAETTQSEEVDRGAFTISRGEGNTVGDLTVFYEVQVDVAALGANVVPADVDSDYAESLYSDPLTLVGSQLIPHGSSSVTFTVTPNDDDQLEWDEVVQLRVISNPQYSGNTAPTTPYYFIAPDAAGNPQDVAKLVILDNDAIVGATSRNIDAESTGQAKQVISNGHIDVDLHQGEVTLALPLAPGSHMARYRGDDNLQPITSVEMPLPGNSVPSQIHAMLTFGGMQGQTVTYSTAGLNLTAGDVLRFVVLGNSQMADYLRSGHYDYDVEFAADFGGVTRTRTVRGGSEIVNRVDDRWGTTEFGRRWWVDELDRLVPGDGITPPDSADTGTTDLLLATSRLAPYGAFAATGMALIRGDNSSAWYRASVDNDHVLALKDDGNLSSIDLSGWAAGTGIGGYLGGYHITDAGLQGQSEEVTWSFSGLAPERPYQVFVRWTADGSRASNAAYTVTGANEIGGAASTKTILVDQRYTPGEILFNGYAYRSLGFYNTAGTLDVTLSTYSATGGFADGGVVADSVLLVSDWEFTTPAGSFNRLEHGAFETGDTDQYFVDPSYLPDNGDFTLVGKHGGRSEFDHLGLLRKRVDRNSNSRDYAYTDADADGVQDELQQITRQGGLTTTYQYASGQLTSVIDFASRSTNYTITNGFVTQITEPTPVVGAVAPVSSFAYLGPQSRISGVTDAEGRTTSVAYDSTSLRTGSVTNPDTRTWNITPLIADGISGIVRKPVSGDIGNREASPVQPLREPRAVYTDPRGLAHDWVYQTDTFGLTTAKANPAPFEDVWRTLRDANGLVAQAIQPSGGGGDTPLGELTTQYTYDDKGNLTSASHPDGTNETWIYDASFSQPTSYTDQLGQVTTYALDGRGNVDVRTEMGTVVLPEERKTQFTYTAAPTAVGGLPGGLVVTRTDAYQSIDAVTTRTDYYGTGHRTGLPSAVTYAVGVTNIEAVVEYDYDAYRNRSHTVDELGRTTIRKFDALDQLVKITQPDPGTGDHTAPVTGYEYDAVGNQTAVIDPRGNRTEQTYDSMNRLATVTQPPAGGSPEADQTNPVTTYGYDAAGNRTSVTDPLGRSTSYEYDQRNYQTAIIEPAPGVGSTHAVPRTEYGYDTHGNLRIQRDPRSIESGVSYVTTFTYDELGRQTKTTRPDPGTGDHFSVTTSFVYDDAGQLKEEQATGPNGTILTKYKYDRFGRQIEVTYPATAAGTNVVTTNYDLRDNRLTTSNSLGQVNEYEYDARNRLVLHALPDPGPYAGVLETLYNHNAAGELIAKMTAVDGKPDSYRITRYKYDDLGRRIEIEEPDPDGAGSQLPRVTRYHYDAAGNQTSVVQVISDVASLTEEYQFDNLNRMWRELGPLLADGSRAETIHIFDRAGQEVRTKDLVEGSRYRETDRVYDNLGRLHQTIHPLPLTGGVRPTVSTIYDAHGSVLSVTDPLGNVTSYRYDRLDREIQRSEPATSQHPAPITQTHYKPDGSVQSVTLNAGTIHESATTHSYDNRGRLAEQSLPAVGGANPIRSWTRDVMGKVMSETDLENKTTQLQYDGLNRNVVTIRPENTPTNPTLEQRYNTYGNLQKEIDAFGNVTDYEYDFADRLIETRYPSPDGVAPRPVESKKYNRLGQLEAEVDGEGNRTQYAYDAMGRLETVTDPNLDVTRITYDLLGRQRRIEDAKGNVTVFDYDDLDRLASETVTVSGVTQTRSYKYDLAGNVVRSVDRGGRIQTYDYDAHHRRITERWYTDAAAETAGNPAYTLNVTYDVRGLPTDFSDNTSSYTFTYDVLQRLEDVIATHPGAPKVKLTNFYAKTGYDPQLNDQRLGLNATISGSADFENIYHYDGNRRLLAIDQDAPGTSLLAPIVPRRVEFVYDAADRLDLIRRYENANLVAVSDYDHDNIGRLSDLVHRDATGALLADYHWTYDDAHRVDTFGSLDGSADYGYDGRGQLTSAVYDYRGDEAYQYDGTGNRKTHTVGDHNRVTADGSYSYEYDDEGNRTRRTHLTTGEVTEYTWDIQNRLVGVTTRASGSGPVTDEVEYTYDMFGRRIAKAIDSDGDGTDDRQEFYVYDGESIVLQFNGLGELTHRYLHGPAVDQVLADEAVDVATSTSSVLWPLADNLGTVRDLVEYDADTATTSAVNHLTYGAFGQVTSVTNAAVDHIFGYTGREVDAESDLYYYRARYYDPQLGQFISEDPIGFAAGDENLYRYVGNGVTNAVDPSGLIHPHHELNEQEEPKDPPWWQRWFFGAKTHEERELEAQRAITKFVLQIRQHPDSKLARGEIGLLDGFSVGIGGKSLTEPDVIADLVLIGDTTFESLEVTEDELRLFGRYQRAVYGQRYAQSALPQPAAIGLAPANAGRAVAQLKPPPAAVQLQRFKVQSPIQLLDDAFVVQVIDDAEVAAARYTQRTGAITAPGRQATQFEKWFAAPTAGTVAPTRVTSQVNPRLTQRLEAFRAYRADGGTMDMARWVKATQGNPAYGTGFKSGFADRSRRVGQPVHGNSLAATGPHDVYVLRNADTGELLHFGETGRDYLTRFAEHQRDYARFGIDIDVELLRTVEGKAAARAFESRYIDTYIRVFGQRPPFNPVNH